MISSDKNLKIKIRKLIDEAGELQKKNSLVYKKYFKKRKQLFPLLKAAYGTDKYVSGMSKKYQAVLSYDKYDFCDPVLLMEELLEVNIKPDVAATIRNIVSIRIMEARKSLDKEIAADLIKTKKNKKPTLYFSRTDKEE